MGDAIGLAHRAGDEPAPLEAAEERDRAVRQADVVAGEAAASRMRSLSAQRMCLIAPPCASAWSTRCSHFDMFTGEMSLLA